MCGILGAVSLLGANPAPELEGASERLAHRGPDDCGVWRSPDGEVTLAHRRLAILDLSPAGHQPMLTDDRQCAIVFNGEIYNFRTLREELRRSGATFSTGTDTEVLLAAYRKWGTSCVDHLEGMFAFAIWDARLRRLFAARDRAGEKPFAYFHGPALFGFASELTALTEALGTARHLDPVAIDHYLALGYVPHPHTIWRGCRKLPPGHALTVDLASRGLTEWAYWRPPAPALRPGLDLDEAASRLEHLLQASVARQLVADVPVGVMLSGGLDSGLVAAYCARHGQQDVRAYTVRMPDGLSDEAGAAAGTGAHLGLDHHIVESSPPNAHQLESLLQEIDEPLGDSSLVPTSMVSTAIRRYAGVALGGDGGDELFGGYPHHRPTWTVRLALQVPPGVRDALGRVASPAYPWAAPGRGRLFRLLSGNRSLTAWPGLFDPGVRGQLVEALTGSSVTRESPERWRDALAPEGVTMLQAEALRDFQSYLPGDVLAKVDRMSMRCSLEVRAPFLDRQVVEFALRDVPDHLKVDRHRGKVLLRHLASRLLPPPVSAAPKQGFSIPTGAWLTGPWRDLCVECLTSRASPLTRRQLAQLLQSAARSRTGAEKLFALLALCSWLEGSRRET